jgi:hypothetical protein
MGWWAPGDPLTAMPASPGGLDMNMATSAYLMSLTAYFFPTVTTQIANVQCRRSWQTSLFSTDFIDPAQRREILEHIRAWRPWSRKSTRPPKPSARHVTPSRWDAWRQWFLFPMRSSGKTLVRLARMLERPLIGPATAAASRFLARHPRILNLVSNPLIDVGTLFELGLCAALFYTGLAHIYYFLPVPWPVYLFALAGPLVLLAFEETKKYYRRKGHALNMLG